MKIFKLLQVLSMYAVLMSATHHSYAKTSKAVPLTKTERCIQQLLTSTDQYREAFFIPQDLPKELLMALINNEQRQILAALYNFTDPDVAKAIIDAHIRGVDVQMITDVEGLRGKYEHITDLYEHAVPVHLYAEYRSLMHNKYLVFQETLGGNAVVWSGSANITKVGLTGNEENVQVSNDTELVQQYQRAWQATKQRIKDAKKNDVRLRDGCKFVGNALWVELGKGLRRFKIFR